MYATTFHDLDTDEDGLLTEQEINAAVLDPKLRPELVVPVSIFKLGFETIAKMHKPFLFRDKDGITLLDLNEWMKVLNEVSTEEQTQQAAAEHEVFRRRGKISEPRDLALIAERLKSRLDDFNYKTLSLYLNQADPVQSVMIHAIQQGFVGNCAFLAALGAVVCTNPEIIPRMIHINPDKTYTVTFPGARDEPQVVSHPTLVELLLYSRPTQHGIWPTILEKAYGMLLSQSSFEPKEIAAENTHKCARYWPQLFQVLTGQASKVKEINSAQYSEVREILQKAKHDHRGVCAWTRAGSCQYIWRGGLRSNHAYTLMDFDNTTESITLRNPWGPIHGSEPATDESEPLDGTEDGIFKISLDKLLSEFSHIHYEDWEVTA